MNLHVQGLLWFLFPLSIYHSPDYNYNLCKYITVIKSIQVFIIWHALTWVEGIFMDHSDQEWKIQQSKDDRKGTEELRLFLTK